MDIDDTITRLRDLPLPPRLAALDGAMLAQMANEHGTDVRRSAAFASALALVIGIAGADLPTESALARNTLTPFSAASPLTPSALLGDAP